MRDLGRRGHSVLENILAAVCVKDRCERKPQLRHHREPFGFPEQDVTGLPPTVVVEGGMCVLLPWL